MSTFLTKNNIVFLCLIYLIVLCSFNLLKEFDYINEYILIGMFFFTFLYFLIISYYKLNLGVHPLFIFIAMLLIFQGVCLYPIYLLMTSMILCILSYKELMYI